MSGLFRLVGKMLMKNQNTYILSRDIINEAKNRTRKMLDHIILESAADQSQTSRARTEIEEDVNHVCSFEERIKTLLLEMGENRVLTTADVTMSRLEEAWLRQQETHRNLASQYDRLVNKVWTFGRDLGFQPNIVTADDVLMLVTKLDRRWRQIQNKSKEMTLALDSKNSQIKELEDFLGVKTPVTESTVFDDIMVRLTDKQSKFIVLEKALKTLAEVFDIAPCRSDGTKIAEDISEKWEESKSLISQLRSSFLIEKDKNSQAQETLKALSKVFGIAPCHSDGTDVAEDISEKWEESRSLISQLRSFLLIEKDKNSQAQETLKTLSKVFDIAPCSSDGTDIAEDISEKWEESRSLISQLRASLLIEKDKNHQIIQTLSKVFDIAPCRSDGTNIAEDISEKWEESKSLISRLRSSLLIVKDKNSQANETLLGLAGFMGVETSGREPAIIGSMMDKWRDTRREVNELQRSLMEEKEKNREEVNDLRKALAEEKEKNEQEVIELQRALAEEKEKARQAEEALQAHLSRPGPVLSSVLTQTDDHQAKPSGQISCVAIQTDVRQAASPGQLSSVASRKDDNEAPPTDQLPFGATHSDLYFRTASPQRVTLKRASVVSEDFLNEADTSFDDDVISPTSQISSVTVTPGDSFEMQLSYRGDAKRNRYPIFYRKAELELDQIKENLSLSISYRSESLATSSSREIVHLDRRCVSLKKLCAGDASKPPSKSTFLQDAAVFTSMISCLQKPGAPNNCIHAVSRMEDLIPWSATTGMVELGSGVSGTVYLLRHAVTKIPVAIKVVEYPGQCFENEVRIQRAVSDLPWFPTFYGTFEVEEDEQGVLAMEFCGDSSEDRSYTLSDCIDKSFLKTGPDLNRDEWFVVLRDVVEGIKAFHSKGFLNNDLKGDNILVVEDTDGRWRAKIIDLGWACEISARFVMPLDEEQIEEYRDTRYCHHIAPECVLDAQPLTTASDVYSLGRLLATVGKAMKYDDIQSYGIDIYEAAPDQRPTVQDILDKLDELELSEGGDDEPGSSSC